MTDVIGIVGIADSNFGKLNSHSYLSLSAELLGQALQDCGKSWADIDGLLVSSSLVTYYNRPASALAEYCGISKNIHFFGGPEAGGASPFLAIAEAVALIASGVCSTVGVVSCDVPRTGQSRDASVDQFAMMRDPDYERPYSLTNVASYALLANAYQHKYGVSDSARASVAVAHRKHAYLNEAAVYREPLQASDVLDSRMVSDPIRLLECRPIVDGGSAIIVTRISKGQQGVAISGTGFGSVYDQINQIRDPSSAQGMSIACRRACTSAGIAPDSVKKVIDYFSVYDSYTIAALLQLEAIGVCGPGAAAELYASGETSASGSVPVNTHGGLLSHGGPGICLVTEAVRQLRGQAVNQVHRASRAFVTGEGGILSVNAALILEV